MDGVLLKNIIGALEPILEEATFNFTEKKQVTLRGLDPQKVSAVNLKCLPGAFKEYECTKPSKITVSISELSKILKRVSGGAEVNLSYNPSKINKLVIRIKGKYTSTFRLNLMNPMIEETPLPRVYLPYIAKFVTKSFEDGLNDVMLYSNNVILHGRKDSITLHGSGDMADVGVEFKSNTDALLSIEIEKNIPEVKTCYSLTFLQGIVKACSPISDIVVLAFDTNKPIQLLFSLPKMVQVTYWLAPRKPEVSA
jgi:proliferating cell nuclear antigen PCNA